MAEIVNNQLKSAFELLLSLAEAQAKATNNPNHYAGAGKIKLAIADFGYNDLVLNSSRGIAPTGNNKPSFKTDPPPKRQAATPEKNPTKQEVAATNDIVSPEELEETFRGIEEIVKDAGVDNPYRHIQKLGTPDVVAKEYDIKSLRALLDAIGKEYKQGHKKEQLAAQLVTAINGAGFFEKYGNLKLTPNENGKMETVKTTPPTVELSEDERNEIALSEEVKGMEAMFAEMSEEEKALEDSKVALKELEDKKIELLALRGKITEGKNNQ